jgi:magnesium transporter
MDFEHMPELDWRLGDRAALCLMGVVCAGLYGYFGKVG